MHPIAEAGGVIARVALRVHTPRPRLCDERPHPGDAAVLHPDIDALAPDSLDLLSPFRPPLAARRRDAEVRNPLANLSHQLAAPLLHQEAQAHPHVAPRLRRQAHRGRHASRRRAVRIPKQWQNAPQPGLCVDPDVGDPQHRLAAGPGDLERQSPDGLRLPLAIAELPQPERLTGEVHMVPLAVRPLLQGHTLHPAVAVGLGEIHAHPARSLQALHKQVESIALRPVGPERQPHIAPLRPAGPVLPGDLEPPRHADPRWRGGHTEALDEQAPGQVQHKPPSRLNLPLAPSGARYQCHCARQQCRAQVPHPSPPANHA